MTKHSKPTHLADSAVCSDDAKTEASEIRKCDGNLWHALCNIQDYIVCEEETPERKLYVVNNELIEVVKNKFATPQVCSSCGDATDYCCADCMIERREKVFVCGKPECRDKHEALKICQEKL